jgi:chorismate dehydratase
MMVRETSAAAEEPKIRVGAVTYLNARPLIFSLPRLAPQIEIVIDLPSRLADALAAGKLDVAMIPSIEYARGHNYVIVSDACIACDGPVRSVKLYSHVPLARLRTLALDEGSRTSAALLQVLLRERFHVAPETRPLPIGVSSADVPTDAVMLIGDRGMLPGNGAFEFEWDLGEEWSRWTGLPFVFAMWIARPGIDLRGLEATLALARDEGTSQLAEIARQAAPDLEIPEADCLSYLRDNLEFRFGPRQRQGLEHFFALAGRQGFSPADTKLNFYPATS